MQLKRKIILLISIYFFLNMESNVISTLQDVYKINEAALFLIVMNIIAEYKKDIPLEMSFEDWVRYRYELAPYDDFK